MKKIIRMLLLTLLVSMPLQLRPSNPGGKALGIVAIAGGGYLAYWSISQLRKAKKDPKAIDDAKAALRKAIQPGNEGIQHRVPIGDALDNLSWISASRKEKKNLDYCILAIADPKNRTTANSLLNGRWAKPTEVEVSKQNPKKMTDGGQAEHFASSLYTIERGINGFDPESKARTARKKKTWGYFGTGLAIAFAGAGICCIK